MLDNDHKPVKLTGLLLLAAILLVFLVIVWLVGSAFVRPQNPARPLSWKPPSGVGFVIG